MLSADLHIHSTISDGTYSVNEIIQSAKNAKLDAIAITDHDTLEHRNSIPVTDGLQVLCGIEISAIDKVTKTKAHILGYNIKEPKKVEALTHPLLERRHENSLRQIKRLEEKGFYFDLDKISKANGKFIYKQHIMEFLVMTAQVKDMFGSFYSTVFKNGGICDFDIEYIDVRTAVSTINSAGGKAVLAHSGQQKNFYLIDKLVPLGLDGLEYNHPENSDEDKASIRKYAEKYGLFLTGGSDFHGDNDSKSVKIGDYLSEESGVLALC